MENTNAKSNYCHDYGFRRGPGFLIGRYVVPLPGRQLLAGAGLRRLAAIDDLRTMCRGIVGAAARMNLRILPR